MKAISIAAAGVSLALIALTLVPSAGEYRAYLAIGALLCSAVAVALIVAGWRERPIPAGVSSPSEPSPVASIGVETNSRSGAPVIAAPPAPTADIGQAEVVGLLATFQEKGRLVDFLQDDITGYSDAQVGAAARVVHQGCRAVLNEHVRIVPVREENEGAKVTVPAGYVADEYRLVGKISGQAPFSGTLMHRGWKVESVSLPRLLRTDDRRFPTIAPAEVELR